MKLQPTHHPTSTSTSDHHHLCLELLSTISTSAPSVQCFKSRWSAISDKLQRLSSAVSSLPDHPLSDDLLRSLADTLSLTLTLSLHCRDPQPPAGKLQTQSELSSAASALDLHLSDAILLLHSPVFEASAASTPSRRELVRTECQSLVTRLQLGSASSKSAVLDSLLELLREDDKNVLIAVAQGVVPVLVRLLESSSSHEAKEKAVVAISQVAAVESCRCVLVGEGLLLLNHLSRVLESGSGLAKEKACAVLQTLTLSKENAIAVGSRGGIAALLEICKAGTPHSQAAAAGVLKNLAGVEEIRGAFIDEKALEVLSRVSASGTAAAQENAVGCVRNLAAGKDRELKVFILREYGIDSMKSYCDGEGRDLEPATGLIRHLASDKYIAEIIVSSGFVPRIVSALDSTSSGTRMEAAMAVCEMAMVGKARREIADGGCVARLVTMLDAKSAGEKMAAVIALDVILVFAENRRAFRKEERGIFNMVQLLSPVTRDVERRYVVSVLLCVSQSRKCRRRMIEAGACAFLQGLVDVEVEGAKKLLENLEKGNLWGMFFANRT